MKLIKAYIHTYRAYDTVQALEREGLSSISAIDIKMLGRDTDPELQDISSEFGIHTSMTKLEFTVQDDRVPAIVSRIRDLLPILGPPLMRADQGMSLPRFTYQLQG